MKNKILLIFFAILTFFMVGCNFIKEEANLEIICDEEVIINESISVNVVIDGERVDFNRVGVSLSDYEIAEFIDGKLYGKDYGTVIITVIDKQDTTKYSSKTVEIVKPRVKDIIITGANELYEEKTIQLSAEVVPSLITSEVTWSSSNTNILTVENGLVYAKKAGTANVVVTCEDFVKEFVVTVLPTPTTIIIEGKNDILIDEVVVFTYNIDEEVILESSNEEVVKVYNGAIIGISEGRATITAKKVSNNDVQGTIEVTVRDVVNQYGMTSEEQEIVEEMLNGMTIDQMIGEMFNIEFASNTSWSGGYRVSVDNSTGLPFAALGYNTSTRKVTEFINDYKFGNFTISNVSGQNISYIENAAKNLREIGLNNTGVEPYITLNYMSSNNMQGLSSMPANIQLASAGETQIITAVNEAYAKQLKYYGINSVTNQYLVNNEDFTSLSTTFGTDIAFAATTAKIISQSYQNHGVAMIPDMSQYGYWGDIREESEIYSKDYRLLESAVNSGTSMIILPAIYYEYLESASMMSIYSELFMKDYLRDELGYKGVLMLDSDATSNIYDEQNFNEDILRAINNGVDMIGYKITFDTRDSSSTRKRAEAPLNLYNYLLTAVENGSLSQGRVKEAVTRILLSKIRNNIFEEKEEVNVEETISVINQHSSKFITAVGNFWSFDESEKILLISEDYSKTGTASSIGDCFGSYFSKIGYSDYKVKHTSKLHPEDELPEASSYNKIFICVSSLNTGTTIGTGGKANFIEFVGDLYEINPNICLIYTSQADMRSYFPNIENYILLNGVYEQTFDTLFSILSGQAQPNNNLLY